MPHGLFILSARSMLLVERINESHAATYSVSCHHIVLRVLVRSRFLFIVVALVLSPHGLKRTALNLPTPLVTAAVGSMRRMCNAIYELGVDLFTSSGLLPVLWPIVSIVANMLYRAKKRLFLIGLSAFRHGLCCLLKG